MKRCTWQTALLGGTLAGCAVGAMAQLGSPDDQTLKLELSAGAVRGTQSLFKGVLVQSRTDPLIGVEAALGRWFFSMLNGAGYLLADTPAFSLGVSGNYMLGRSERSQARYRGLGDVDGTLAAYAFFEWRPVKDAVTVYGNVMRSTRAQSGTEASLGATLGLPLTAQLSGFVDVYANWADARYARSYYGVNATQALGSGLAAYAPSAGLISVTPSVGLDYTVDAHWHVLGFAGRSRFGGMAADSPLVQGLGRSQPVAAVFVKYMR